MLTGCLPFGTEKITLIAKDWEIKVNFSIRKATIALALDNCDYLVLEPKGIQVQETTIKTTDKDVSEAGFKGKGSIGSKASLLKGADATVEARSELEAAIGSKSTTEVHTKVPTFYAVGQVVTVGPIGHKPLNGPVITNYVGWTIIPRTTNVRSAVAALLNVRDDWIDLELVEILRHPVGLKEKIKQIFSAPSKSRRFKVLLEHLAAMELGQFAKDPDATIAASVIVVKPEEDRLVSVPTLSERRTITINGAALKEYVADFVAEVARDCSSQPGLSFKTGLALSYRRPVVGGGDA